MSLIRTAFLSGLIPFLGLVSCNQNRTSEPAPVAVDDTWKLPAPQVVTVRNGEKFTEDFAAATKLDSDSQILFPIGSTEDFSGTVISVDSTCFTAAKITSLSKIALTGLNKFSMISLIPKELWLRRDLHVLEGLTCTFHFLAEDAAGSTHEFTAPNVMIQNPQVLEQTKVVPAAGVASEAPAALPDFLTVHANISEGYRLSPLPPGKMKSDYNLECDHLENHRERPRGANSDGVLKDLLTLEIEGLDPRASDPRTSFSLQTCRLIVRSTDAATGELQVQFTPMFQVRFSKPPATVTVSKILDLPPSQDTFDVRLNRQPTFSVDVRNDSSSIEAFRFPASGLTLTFVPFYNSPPTILHDGPYSSPVTASVTNAVRFWQTGNEIVFEVGAGASVQIYASLSTDWFCTNFAVPPGLPPLLLGFEYRFSQPFYLRQFTNWDANQVRFDGEVVDVPTPLSTTTTEPDGLPSGWSSNSIYDRVVPNLARPTGTPQLPMMRDGTCQAGTFMLL